MSLEAGLTLMSGDAWGSGRLMSCLLEGVIRQVASAIRAILRPSPIPLRASVYYQDTRVKDCVRCGQSGVFNLETCVASRRILFYR
jgi:hypothetical protein